MVKNNALLRPLNYCSKRMKYRRTKKKKKRGGERLEYTDNAELFDTRDVRREVLTKNRRGRDSGEILYRQSFIQSPS